MQYFPLSKSLQVNLDMTDSMVPGKLVRHMQNLSYTYDEYLICIGLRPSILSVICHTVVRHVQVHLYLVSYQGLVLKPLPVTVTNLMMLFTSMAECVIVLLIHTQGTCCLSGNQ